MSRTHEALLRAEAKREAIYCKTQGCSEIEQKMLQLKLGREELEGQNLSELTQSLHTINKFLKEPSKALKINSSDSSLKLEDILPILLRTVDLPETPSKSYN